MSIGKNIKKLRESRGMSQAQLADILGVTDKAVSSWELDMKVPRMGSIEKIASYFNVTKSRIVDDEPLTSDDEIKVALFGGDGEVTPAMWEEVKSFAELVKIREEQKKKGKQ